MAKSLVFVVNIIIAIVIPFLSACSQGQNFPGKEKVLSALKDPDSATFKDVEVSTFNGAPLVCGETNAKNSYGGYTGFRHFMVKEGSVYLSSSDLDSMKLDLCCYVSSSQSILGNTDDWAKRHEDACGTLEIQLMNQWRTIVQ